MEYDIWYTSGDSKGLEFIRSMRKYNKRLGKNALMTPHMMVWLCRHCTEPGADCKRVGENIYCPPPSLATKLSGRETIDMGLEELCIYDIYKNVDNAEKWWEYMDNVYFCQFSNFGTKCIAEAKEKAGIDSRRLTECLGKSNEIMQNEFNMWQSSGILYNPAIVVNNHVYRVFFMTFYREKGNIGCRKCFPNNLSWI